MAFETIVAPPAELARLFAERSSRTAHRVAATSRRVLAITDSPKPPSRRLTLTLPALAGAEIYIAAFGAAKAAVMREALHAPASPLPVARAARLGTSAVFLLDDEAGKLLQPPFID